MVKSHGNIDSVKMLDRPKPARSTEDIAVDPFLTSSFGSVVMALFQDTLSAPSWHSFTYLAYGWSLAWGRQTITTSLWLSGAACVKHFSRYYAFVGGPLYKARYRLWAQIIRCGASFIAPDEAIRVHVDDHTAKKSGRHIQGRDRYRNGAGSARQEYRMLAGINLVLCTMRIPLKVWPGHALSLPIGLERSLKAKLAGTLGVPYHSRSALARRMVDFAAEHLPTRRLCVSGDGEFATHAFLRTLPPSVEVTGRLLITAKLSQPPPPRRPGQRGAPRKKGDLIGSAKTLAPRPPGGAHTPAKRVPWCRVGAAYGTASCPVVSSGWW
jgi:hypothetical protein